MDGSRTKENQIHERVAAASVTYQSAMELQMIGRGRVDRGAVGAVGAVGVVGVVDRDETLRDSLVEGETRWKRRMEADRTRTKKPYLWDFTKKNVGREEIAKEDGYWNLN